MVITNLNEFHLLRKEKFFYVCKENEPNLYPIPYRHLGSSFILISKDY